MQTQLLCSQTPVLPSSSAYLILPTELGGAGDPSRKPQGLEMEEGTAWSSGELSMVGLRAGRSHGEALSCLAGLTQGDKGAGAGTALALFGKIGFPWMLSPARPARGD